MRAAVLAFLAGCSPLGSAMHPADVLEEGEMHVGAAVGALAPVPGRHASDRDAAEVASPTGFSTELELRRGFEDAWEAGLSLAPTAAGLDARFHLLGDEHDWVATLGAGLGAALPGIVRGDAGQGSLVGASVDLLAGKNWSDVLRLWVGPRFSLGRFDARHASGWAGGAGLTLGIATGYRYLFAAAELTPIWTFSTGDVGVSGIVLAPAFGLWLRW